MANRDEGKSLTSTNKKGKVTTYDPSSEACTEEEEGEPPNIATQQQSNTISDASSLRSIPTIGTVQDVVKNKYDEKHIIPATATTTTTTTTTTHLQPPTTEEKIDLHRPHTLTTEETLKVFKVDLQNGLTSQEAKSRLDENGENVIRETKAVSIWSIALRQVANALTVILLAAMALSFGVQDWVEGGVVSAVIVVNVVIGFVQEYKAENALASLRSLSSPTSTVIRDQGKIQEIDARQVTLGDIVHFKTGDVVPADVRIITLSSLEIDEAPLTGESVPVLKTSDALYDISQSPLPPADRTNLAFAGTTVTKGRGAGVVVAIGMQTQIGQIAAALDKKNANKHHLKKPDGSPAAWYNRAWEPMAKLLGLRDGTPLQRKLSRFALILLGLAIICAIIVFAVAEFDLNDDVILYAIALGIGVLPESLVAVLTITFSVGAKRMANSNVIVRKLEALEALGGVTDICSDKTGTLTHGKMIVDKIWTPSGKTLSVEKGGSSVLEPIGQLFGEDKEKVDNSEIDVATKQLCLAASLCNVAQIWYDQETKQWSSRGDPTEVALQVLAQKVGLDREELLKTDFTFEQEHAFDSTTKRMTMMFTVKGEHNKHLFMKGAPERVLDCCSTFSPPNSSNNIPTSLNEEVKKSILDQMETLASQGLRVLAFADRKVDVDLLSKNKSKFASSTSSSIQLENDQTELAHGQLPRAEAEQDFHFVGLCGLYDPPRNETYGSVKSCQNAGIVVRMITGDHIATARAIAKEVGILDGTESESAVMSANEFDQLTEQEIDKLPTLPLVVARCSPTTKVRMIAAGARRGRLLAMTGDGINDAPALLNAPIGIAMGSGTDVAKDSAELILTDDKFDNIAKAVKEGRTVFKNIQRFMIALLVLNVAEVLLLLIGLALRDSNDDSIFPISPIGVLFLNLIAGLPAIGLGFEKAETDVMRKPPHDLKGGVLSKQVLWDLFVYGLTMGWTCLIVFIVMLFGIGDGSLGFECNDDGPFCHNVFEARSATFTALFLQGLIIPWHLISMEQSLLRINPVKRLRLNPFLLWSVLFGIVTIPICLYVPKWNTVVFRQASLGGAGWGIALAAVAIFWLVLEGWKYFARRNHWPWLTKISGGDCLPLSKVEAEEASSNA